MGDDDEHSLRDPTSPRDRSGGRAGFGLGDRWVATLELHRWPKVLSCALLGQAIGVASSGNLSLIAFVSGGVFTVCLLVALVLLDDALASDMSRLEQRLLADATASEPRDDRLLVPKSKLFAGCGAVAIGLGMTIFAGATLLRPGLTISAALGLLVLALYRIAPLRMRDWGGIEVVEMLALGFALPWWNAYLQGGAIVPTGVVVLPGFALLCLANALGDGLRDEVRDRLALQRTFTTMFGAEAVRQGIEGLVIAAMMVFAALPWLAPEFAHPWMMFPVVAVTAGEYRLLRAYGLEPDVAGEYGVAIYQEQLERCVRRASLVLALTTAISGWVAVAWHTELGREVAMLADLFGRNT